MSDIGPYTQKIAAFAAAYRFEKLPVEAVQRAKEIVLDSVGAILLGSRPEYRGVWLLGDLARSNGGRGRCSVFGRDFKASLLDATLVNGTMGYAADAEGGSISRMHAAATFVPTALTVGEYLGASGKSVISAICLAYDVGPRVSDALDPGTPYPHSFHPSAVFGHFGAAAAAGHLLGLDESQFANALGLAGINAGGLTAWVDDASEDSRPFVIGVAAQAGTRAALLAEGGMGGPTRILDDAKYTVYEAFSGVMHPERLLQGLGKEFRITEAGGYKRYACCGHIHAGVDALLSILSEHGLDSNQVHGITHWVKPSQLKVIDSNPLKSHNAQYILSVAAVNGGLDPEDILVDRRCDPRVADLYSRASLLPEPELESVADSAPAVVEVRTRDGRTFTRRVDHPKGSRQQPFSADEMKENFVRWATRRVDLEQAQGIQELVVGLDELEDSGELARLLMVSDSTNALAGRNRPGNGATGGANEIRR